MVSVRLPNKATIGQANQCGTLPLNIGMWNTLSLNSTETGQHKPIVQSHPPRRLLSI